MSEQTHALTAILVKPERQAEITAAASEVRQVLIQLHDYPCESDQDLEDLGVILAEVRGRLKDLEEARTSITKPLNAAKKAVDDLFSAPKSLFQDAERLIREKINSYAMAKEKERQKALQAAAEAARAQLPPVPSGTAAQAPMVAQAPAPAALSGSANVYFRHVWEWEITDQAKVPAHFLMVNPKAVEAHMAPYQKGEAMPEVPGLRFTRRPVATPKG